jgi:hypothetical protein
LSKSNAYSSVNTETKLLDLCVRTYQKDLKRSKSSLWSAEYYYSSKTNKNSDEILDHNTKSENTKSTIGSNIIENDAKDFKSHSQIHETIKIYNNNNYGTVQQNEFNNNRNRSSKVRNDIQSSARQRTNERTGFGNGRDNQRLSTKPGEVKAQKQYKRQRTFSIPSFYDDLHSYFYQHCPSNIPIFGERPSRRSIEARDEKAFEAYTGMERAISKNMLNFVCGSFISAFSIMGLYAPFESETSDLQKPLSVKRAVNLLAKNTNSGFPDFKRKNNPNVIKDTIFWVKQFLTRPTFYRMRNRILRSVSDPINFTFSELNKLPVYIMHRFQISPIERLGKEFEIKIRPVWCVPFSIVTLEAMFFSPMIDRIKNNCMRTTSPVFPIGFSNKQLSQRIMYPFSRKVRKSIHRKVKSTDFSRFDQSIEPYFTSFFFTIWRRFLNLSENQEKAYNALRFYSCFVPFIDDGKIYVTRKGVCSGSYTTNIRDTLVNLTLLVMAYRIKYNNPEIAIRIVKDFLLSLEDVNHDFRKEVRKNTHRVHLNFAHVYGDDGIVFEDDEFFKIHKFLCEDFGMKISYEDVLKDDSIFFLGRFWDKNGLPWQTYEYMIAHITFRTKWYREEDLDFKISKYLNLYRVLSICLPFKNGKQFLYNVLYEWPDFKEFIENDKGFYLLKEWPHDEYSYVSRENVFDIFSY